MILATDVHYLADHAIAAAVLFARWEEAVPAAYWTVRIDTVADYIPGQFYQRELPCLMQLISQAPQPISCVVVDGYVDLGGEQQPGLGRHLWHALQGQTPVLGVAKTRFADTPDNAALYRGKSEKPLFISAAGIELEQAKAAVARMHGPHRLPSLLKRVDQLCRGIEAAGAL